MGLFYKHVSVFYNFIWTIYLVDVSLSDLRLFISSTFVETPQYNTPSENNILLQLFVKRFVSIFPITWYNLSIHILLWITQQTVRSTIMKIHCQQLLSNEGQMDLVKKSKVQSLLFRFSYIRRLIVDTASFT